MWALFLEWHGGLSSKAEIAAEFDRRTKWGTELRPDRSTWGEGDDARDAAAGMVALAGGVGAYDHEP